MGYRFVKLAKCLAFSSISAIFEVACCELSIVYEMGSKRIISVFLMLLASTFVVSAQQRLTLEEVWERTRTHYPLVAQKVVIQEMSTSAANALWNAYLPQFSLHGRASYQTSVPEVTFTQKEMESTPTPSPVPMPSFDFEEMLEFPVIPRDHYRAYMEGSQLIWDGGRVVAGQKLVNAEANKSLHQVEVKLHELQKRVQEIYFGILILDAQSELQRLLIQEIEREQSMVESAMESGTAHQNDFDQVQVELLRARQTLEQMAMQRMALVEMLSLYMGEQLGADFQPVEPVVPEVQMGLFRRPELALFQSDREVAKAEWGSYTSRLLPTLALFSHAGYGRPGYNMFDPNWAPMLMVGVQMKWDFGELYNFNAERKKRDRKYRLADLQEETYKMEMSVQQQQKLKEVERYKKLLESDREITQLRQKIKERGEVQVQHGTLSHSDHTELLTQHTAALQEETLHRLQYLKALYELKLINE